MSADKRITSNPGSDVIVGHIDMFFSRHVNTGEFTRDRTADRRERWFERESTLGALEGYENRAILVQQKAHRAKRRGPYVCRFVTVTIDTPVLDPEPDDSFRLLEKYRYTPQIGRPPMQLRHSATGYDEDSHASRNGAEAEINRRIEELDDSIVRSLEEYDKFKELVVSIGGKGIMWGLNAESRNGMFND